MISLDDDGLTGTVKTAILYKNGYSREEIDPGNIVRFTEGNVIYHVYIESIGEDSGEEQADFMVYWPG